jgi:FkbM family methyltransferase
MPSIIFRTFQLAQDLCLNLQNGTQLIVPNRLDAITTYVILEQERWFEKEWGFVERLLQPGMTALDIGANLGIYSMGMAKAVGPSGRVYAYEPTSETRARLERSKAINGADNLLVIGSALSDTEREGRIVFGTSSELNQLGEAEGGAGEAVHLTSLELEAKRLDWGAIDFIKMDAEGEELKIIAGGGSVFKDGAPIVMFEIEADIGYDPAVGQQFQALGYGLYRLLPDEQHLVPFVEEERDRFELNLFAVKPEPARNLAQRGMLVAESSVGGGAGNWMQFAASLPCRSASDLFDQVPSGNDGAGLAAYAGWRDVARPINERFGWLQEARRCFAAAVAEERTLARLLSLSRAEFDFGRRSASFDLLVECGKAIDRGLMPHSAFLPVSARYETLTGDFKTWLSSSCIEALQQRGTYSTYYGRALPQLDWVAGTAFATSEIERRRALSAAVRRLPLSLRRDLRLPAPDHLNAEAWAKLMA